MLSQCKRHRALTCFRQWSKGGHYSRSLANSTYMWIFIASFGPQVQRIHFQCDSVVSIPDTKNCVSAVNDMPAHLF